jgi:phytoene/squalene synthetase
VKPDVPELITSTGGRYSVRSIDEAFAWCTRLASSHYENFPVASWLLPARIRLYVTSVYAFARFADDVADEPWTNSVSERTEALKFIEVALSSLNDYPTHPIFLALKHTVDDCSLPLHPFYNLLSAFKNDVEFQRPDTWDEVYNYCSLSANPVGELVLRISGESSSTAISLSNNICTALQIINFVQDTSIDRSRGRTTYPGTAMEAIQIASELFRKGVGVVDYVDSWRLKLELMFIIAGGIYITQLCKRDTHRLSSYRPTIKPSDYLRIVFRVATGTWKDIH